MPIRLIIETIESDEEESEEVYKSDIALGDARILPDYVNGQQNILYVACPEDDLGGRIYRHLGVIEREDGTVVEKPVLSEDFLIDDHIIVEIPIAGHKVHEMTTRENVRLQLRAEHIGQMAMFAHPNTLSPIACEEINFDPTLMNPN